MTTNLWQKLTNEENFVDAWNKVHSNLGAPGIDRVSVEEFEQNLQDNLALLRKIVADGSYQPLPLLTFNHPKKSGKLRTLHVPTVRDRVVQQAVLQVIQPVYEPIFLNCSYAYRPGKSAMKAVERVERNLKRGRTWIFFGDIENFFDEIDRPLLLQILAETIQEKTILNLIERTIQTLENDTQRGIAQGLVLAPILSNIYLHQMDDRMMRARWNYVRYSDNLLVLDQTETGVQAAFDRAKECLTERHLQFNADKTAVHPLKQGFSFLGFYFDARGKRPDEPALQRLDAKITQLLQKTIEYSDAQLQQKLDSIIRGWLNYFQLDETDRRKLLAQLEQKFASQTDSLPQRLIKAAIALQLGDRSRAHTEITTAPAIAAEDADMNYQWGVICELVGLQSDALDSYLAAYRINTEHPEAAARLGLYYLRHQQSDLAIRYLKKAAQLNPQNPAIQFALATAFRENGLAGPAQYAFQKAVRLDARLQQFKHLHRQPPATTPASTPLTYNDDDVAAFQKAFSGREGVFARQWLSDNGKIGYQPLYRHISAQDIAQHLDGQQTLGIYLMRIDNTVHQLLIDLDVTKQVRLEIPGHAAEPEDWFHLLQNDAVKIVQLCANLKINAYIEDSGYKGRHVWIFFTEPQPARDVILLGKKILQTAGAPPTGLHREIFPNQARVSTKALGPMVKLPLGIHKLTQQRCLFLQSNGQPYTDQLAVVRNFEPVPTTTFRNALEQLKAPSPATTVEITPAQQQAIDKIFAGCNVLRYLKEKAETQKILAHIDRLTILGILGHFGPAGHQTIHQIMSHTLNYNQRITERWISRLKGFPVSCPKIREWQSHITPAVGCFCKFPHLKDSYPAPGLHADPEFTRRFKQQEKAARAEAKPPVLTDKKTDSASATSPAVADTTPIPATTTAPTPKPATPVPAAASAPAKTTAPAHPPATATEPEMLDVNEIFRQYLHLKKQQREVDQKITQLEQQLDRLCQQQHTDHFITEAGTFKRVQVEGEFRWMVEI